MTVRPSGTVTFLFTDIEGSTRLWEEQAEAMKRALERHDDVLRELIAAHEGYVFTTAGDAFAAAFSDPKDALAASIAIQQVVGDEPWEVGVLRVRMGLHAGVAHERDGDYFGPVVNRTARIMSAGHGGQVLLSQTIRDLMVERLPAGVELRSLGEHHLKDLGVPEHLFQLVHADLRNDFPELRTLNAHLNNLPTAMTSFIGRHDELEETVKRLHDVRLVTLTGVGGAGKTRLALQAAAEVVSEFPDGVWLVELASLVDAQTFPRWVAEDMGILRAASESGGEDGKQSPMEMVIGYFKTRTSLLVLDNCEHLIAAAAEFSNLLLRSCPNLKVLTTSREGLGIIGERLIQVPSLGLPSVLGIDGEKGGYPDAMELFAERASAVNSRFVLDSESAPAVASICRRLDGLPLAIELAAARVRMLNVDQISERLSDSFRLLTGGSRTALPRQQTLLATVEWSYGLLDTRERLVFDRLAVFRGGFFLEAAEAIVSGDGVDEFEVFDVLASLVDKSMVQAGPDSGRFRLLETLRQFALSKLAEAADQWRARHAAYYQGVATEAYDATRDNRQVEWFERLERDQDNIDAALSWALESGNLETAGRIADGVWWFWGAHVHYARGLRHLEAILPHLDELPLDLQVGLLTGKCYLEMDGGSWSKSVEAGDGAVALARDLGDDLRLSLALLYRSNIVGHSGRPKEAHAGYDEGYEVSRRIGFEWGMGWHMLNKAWIHRMQEENEEANRWFVVAKRHFLVAGNQLGLAWALTGEGMVHRNLGEFDEAIGRCSESLALQEQLGDRGGVAFNLMVMSSSLDDAGRPGEALVHSERALALYREGPEVYPGSLTLIAMIRRHAGDLEGCFELLKEAVLGLGSQYSFVVVAEGVAGLLVTLGEAGAAAPLVGYARAARMREGFPLTQIFVAEREVILSAIRAAMPDHEAVFEEWSHKQTEDVLPVLLGGLDLAERLLEQRVVGDRY